MKLRLKRIFYFLFTCAGVSSLVYYYTGQVALAISVWVIYLLCLAAGNLAEFIFSRLVNPIHVEVLGAWVIFLVVSLLAAGVDYLYIMPGVRRALEINYPLGVSLLLWAFYGGTMVIFTLLFYITQRTCPHCRGVTPRGGNYCSRCGQALVKQPPAGPLVPPGEALEQDREEGSGKGEIPAEKKAVFPVLTVDRPGSPGEGEEQGKQGFPGSREAGMQEKEV